MNCCASNIGSKKKFLVQKHTRIYVNWEWKRPDRQNQKVFPSTCSKILRNTHDYDDRTVGRRFISWNCSLLWSTILRLSRYNHQTSLRKWSRMIDFQGGHFHCSNNLFRFLAERQAPFFLQIKVGGRRMTGRISHVAYWAIGKERPLKNSSSETESEKLLCTYYQRVFE